MPKNKKIKYNLFNNRKHVIIASIVLLAVVGTAAVGFSLASEPEDYSLKQVVEKSVISFEEDSPQMLVRKNDGKIVKEAGGKSINITTNGLVYCTTNTNEVKVTEISEAELSQTVVDIDSKEVEKDTITQEEVDVSIGNNKTLQVSDGLEAGEIRQGNEGESSSINEVELILEEICSKATETVPANQVPVFVGDEDAAQSYDSNKDFLSFLFPKVSAGGDVNVASGGPVLKEWVENDQVAKINNERSRNGLPILGRSQCMTNAARTWTRHMASVNKLYHSNIQDTIEKECGPNWWRRIGENV